MGCVYLLESPSGKRYVGITIHTAQSRFKSHIVSARIGLKHPIARAIRKYGPKNFKIRTLHMSDSIRKLQALERHEIAKRRTLSPSGYNLCRGGECSPLWHPEARRKAGLSSRRRWGRMTAKERRATTVVQIAAMARAIADPLIEARRRRQISATMRRLKIGTGAKNSASILTAEKVRAMRAAARNVPPALINAVLAKRYGISLSTVKAIVRGQRWKNSGGEVVAVNFRSHPLNRALVSERTKAAMADPAIRMKVSNGVKAVMARPGMRKKVSERSKAAWRDPVKRKRMLAAQAAARAARAAKEAA